MARKDRSFGLDRLLTEVELELMQIVWKLSGATVHEVLEALPKGRELAYTSVSTILRILEQKRVLTAQKRGRGHFYKPRFSKEAYEALSVKELVNKVFDATPS